MTKLNLWVNPKTGEKRVYANCNEIPEKLWFIKSASGPLAQMQHTEANHQFARQLGYTTLIDLGFHIANSMNVDFEAVKKLLED